MADVTMVELDEHELLTFVRRNLEWGNADVFAFGRRDRISRLGEIAGYVSMMYDGDDRPRADGVRIILPPTGDGDRTNLIGDVHEGIRRAYRRFEPDDSKTAPMVDATIADLRIDQAANYSLDALLSQLVRVTEREFAIVGDAAHYRSSTVDHRSGGPSLPEDVWCVHLHALMLEAETIARTTGSYVLLDIGEYLPSRSTNVDLLMSAGDVGLCGGSRDDELTPEEIIAMVQTAHDAATAGDVGRALNLVDTNEHLSERRRWVLRLIVLDAGGVRDEVTRILDESAEMIAELKDEDLIGIARIAASVDRDDYAQDLLVRALPGLVAAHDLEAALTVAVNTRRHALIAIMRDRLAALHPGSAVLGALDGRTAARSGDYGRAATLLATSRMEGEREIADFYRMLADELTTENLADPVVLARRLARKKPAWATEIYRETIRTLERTGRRDVAVVMLFAADVEWDEGWFVFAKGMLVRSLASGSRAFGPPLMSVLVRLAVGYMAQHPAAGHARTSVADLLGVEHVGMAGIAVLLQETVKAAERQSPPRVHAEQPSKSIDDLSRLPNVLAHVLQWLHRQGDGMIVSGRDAMPSEVLGEDPDAILHGILHMVDQHAPDPNEHADELAMRHFVTIALAVAPGAVDHDADISVMRGAAIKMAVGNRPQVARDLAEQIMQTAGQRPDRRRRALAAFADVYARVGRNRESMLALMAAFELPSDGSWKEAFTEQSVLLRVLRDVGMTEGAQGVIDRLRSAADDLEVGAVYHSRLQTMELHVQRRMVQSGHPDAWSTSRILQEAVVSASTVLAMGDEALPSAVMLRQLIDQVEPDDASLPEASALLERLRERLEPPHRMLVDAVGSAPDASLVAAMSGTVQTARYDSDVAYDLRIGRTMASRLARTATEAGDREGFAYAIELLGDQGVGVRTRNAEVVRAGRLLSDVTSPLKAAADIAQRGVAVVGLALDENGLMAMSIDDLASTPPTAVGPDVFDPKLLAEWIRRFPGGYGTEGFSSEDFRFATQGLGLPELPPRAVIVSGQLSRVPPNVLTVGQTFAGRNSSLASVPSLAWLTASLDAGRIGDGSTAAWVPIAAGGSYMDTLALMAGEMESVLGPMEIELHTQSATPAALASADLAIIGAHGGLAEENRYFRGLSDDRQEPADLLDLVDAVRGSRVAILFACSGGRMDVDPDGGGILGIPFRLLGQGLEAVIAPAWSVPFNIVRPWLDAFLTAWIGDCMIIDACRAANDAVAAASSDDPARYLAMTLCGNPFALRGSKSDFEGPQ